MKDKIFGVLQRSRKILHASNRNSSGSGSAAGISAARLPMLPQSRLIVWRKVSETEPS